MTAATLQSKDLVTIAVKCPRCDGRGHMSEFAHVANGRCFLCSGEKTIDLKYAVNNEKKTVKFQCTVFKGMSGNFNYMDITAHECTPDGRIYRYAWAIYLEDADQARAMWASLRGNPKVSLATLQNGEADPIYYQDWK